MHVPDRRSASSRPPPARGRRVALVSGGDAGHALPVLGVAAALRRRGHTVRSWTAASHAATGAAHGVPVAPLPDLPDPHGVARRGFGEALWARAAVLAPLLAADIGAWQPDLLVVDTLTTSGALAASLLERPWVEVVPHHLADPADDLPPVGLGRPMPRTPWRRWDDRRIVAAQRRSVALGEAQARDAAADLDLDGVAVPALRLLATLPGLERPRRRWPADAHVVGPLAVDPAGPALAPPAGGAPLVLVTDSTATALERSLAATALAALHHLDVRVVVTSGRVPPHRASGVVVGSGPHGPLLAEAAVAVGPGGGGFVAKASAAGVPLVVVPLAGDQRETAARLEDAGAGRAVPPWRLTARSLRWAVLRQLHDPRPARAAADLAIQAAGLGADLAARLVEDVVAGAPPRASGPCHHLDGGSPADPGGGAGRWRDP